jgi:hypothetical protein
VTPQSNTAFLVGAQDQMEKSEKPLETPDSLDVAPMTLVTGADSSHFLSLLQFLASVVEHEPDLPVVVYDLGLHPYEEAELEERFPRYWVRRFPYEKYPPHVNLRWDLGHYAWKPIIVWEVLKDTTEPVCWMDAGNVLTARLNGIRHALRTHGFYSPRSSGTIMDWTHPAMSEYFAVEAEWATGKPNLNGACVAFHPRSPRALDLAQQWRNGALIKDCIAPEGSSRENHRQDQALLTVLAYKYGLVDATNSSYLGFEIHRDIDGHNAGRSHSAAYVGSWRLRRQRRREMRRRSLRQGAVSQDEFERWFKEQVQATTDTDLNTPPAPADSRTPPR